MKNLRPLVFFILIFLLFYIAIKFQNFLLQKGYIKSDDLSIIVSGLAFVLIISFIYYTAKICVVVDNYQSFELDSGAVCKGGEYMWQGDSPEAKFCRNLASTEEGKCQISQFNCPNGFVGEPITFPEYSTNSDSNWSGVDCNQKGCNTQTAGNQMTYPKGTKCDMTSLHSGDYLLGGI